MLTSALYILFAMLAVLIFSTAWNLFAVVMRKAIQRWFADVRCPQCRHAIPKCAVQNNGLDCQHCDWALRPQGGVAFQLEATRYAAGKMHFCMRCPRCSSAIPDSHLTVDGLSCGCGWRLVRRCVKPAANCKRCGGMAREQYGGILLWDDAWYCTNCVRQADGQLLKYAKSNMPLSETTFYSRWGVVWMSCLVATLGTLCGGVIFSLFAIQAVVTNDVPVTVALGRTLQFCGVLWCVFVSAAVPVSTFLALQSLPRTILVNNGFLHVTTPRVSVPIKELTWSPGNPTRDVTCVYACLPWRQTGLLLFLPEHAGGPVFVGQDASSLRIWTAFLELAQIGRHELAHRGIARGARGI